MNLKIEGQEVARWLPEAAKSPARNNEEEEPIFSASRSPSIRKADPQNILGSGHLHPTLVRRAASLIESASRQGMNLYVVQGSRSLEEQARLLESGRGVTRAKPGHSFHNFGLAVDIAFQDEKGRPSWSEHHDWKKLGALGKEAGLVWGGDWKKIKDRPHFQLLPNDRISTVRKLSNELGVEKMWETIR